MPGLRARASRALAREALMVACQHYELGAERSDAPAELVALAHEISPESRHSRLQRAYDRHVAAIEQGRRPRAQRRVTTFGYRVVNHVQFRYWRRTGLPTAKRSM